MEILGYVILVFGVMGIGLGLYGLFMPRLKRLGFSLPRPRLPGSDGSQENVDQLIEELEQAGFRNSPFEALAGSKAAAPVTERVARAAREAPRPLPHNPEPSVEPLHQVTFLPKETIDEEADVDEDEELDPVVAELLAEAQADVEQTEPPGEDVLEPEAGQPEARDEAVQPNGDVLDGDMLALFAETTTASATPEALRDIIPQVTIQDLLAEAREVRRLLAGDAQGDSSRVA